MYFNYGQTEIAYLTKQDKKMGEAIAKIGMLKREVNTDIFCYLIYSIVGQQISSAATKTVWKRINEKVDAINATNILSLGRDKLQQCGLSYRKAEYIIGCAEKVASGELDLESLRNMSDTDVIKKLTILRGIGVWTAEMVLIFSLLRPNVISYGDFAILRGMKILYNLESIDRQLFAKYAQTYAPYASVASLYLWEIATRTASQSKNNKGIEE